MFNLDVLIHFENQCNFFLKKNSFITKQKTDFDLTLGLISLFV